MKIAFLIEIPTPYRDSFFAELNRNQDFDFEVIYCAASEYGRGWKEEEKKYPCKILSGFSYPVVGKNIFVLKVNPGIWGQLSRVRYDTVIISGYIQPTMQLAILWCLWHKVPYILWSESHNLKPRPIFKRLLKRPLVRLVVKKAAAFLCMGSNSRDYLISYGAAPDKVFFFPNIPDVKKISEESSLYRQNIMGLRRALGIQGNPVVIYSGRLIGIKNIKTLLKAFELVQYEIPQAGLVLAGEGPLRSRLESLARELKLNNVYFAGFIPPKDLVKYYVCADIFVFPSYNDQWGVVVQEAMACGLPVVVSDKVGCARDLVLPNRNGYILPAENTEGFASAILKLLQDSRLRSDMGILGQGIALKWDYDFAISQLKQALNSVN